jgi:hypothetical protein
MAATETKPDIKSMKGPEALFKTSSKLEQEGIWLDYGDFRIKITRAGATNKRFKKLMEDRMKPHRRAMANDTMSNDLAERITRDVWAECIVLGWDSALGSNVMPYKGAPFQFSVDACKTLFIDLPDLYIDVRDQSMKLGLFLDGDEELDTGN